MSKKSNPVRNTLLIVGGVLGMLLLFSLVLRAALAPLYQDVAQIQSREKGAVDMAEVETARVTEVQDPMPAAEVVARTLISTSADSAAC